MSIDASGPPTQRWIDLLLRGAHDENVYVAGSRLHVGEAETVELDDADLDTAIRLVGLLQERGRRMRELLALNDVAGRLAATHERDPLLAEVVRQSRRLLDVDLAYIGLSTDDGVRIEVTDGALSGRLDGLIVPSTEGVIGRVLSTSAPVWTPDYLADSTFRHGGRSNEAAGAEIIHGLLGVPLEVGGRALGVLCVAKRRARQFTEDDIMLLSALAAHASVAIDTSQLLERYRTTVDEVRAAHRELERRAVDLEQMLAWDAALTEIVLKGGGLRQVLDEASRSAGSDVFMFTDIDEVHRHIPPEFTTRVLDTVRANVAGSDRTNDIVGSTEVVLRPVVATGTHLGFLLTVVPCSLSPRASVVIDRAAPVIALIMAAERAAQESVRRARDAFVVDLVTRQPESEADQQHSIRLAGLPTADTYTVAVMSYDGELSNVTRLEVERRCRDTKAVVAQRGQRYVVVAPGIDAAHFGRAWSVAPQWTVGLASTAAGSGESIASTYRQSEQVLNTLLALDRAGACASSVDLGVFRILLSDMGRRDIAALTDRWLGPLLAEQVQRGAPLLDTLSCYLDQARRHSATAAALDIHVNTLYQRLATIDRLLGEQWREADNALELQLALRLRRLASDLS